MERTDRRIADRVVPTQPASQASLFTVGPTLNAGFGAFAATYVNPDTLLLKCPSPAAFVIFRYFRKEVCARCFAYDRGRQWKIRDNRCGVVFCGVDCQVAWLDDHPPLARDALAASESFIQSRSWKLAKKSKEDVLVRKIASDDQHWHSVQEQALQIRAARSPATGTQPTKRQNKALRDALNLPLDDPDILPFVLSGILTQSTNPDLWTQLLSLVPHRHPYSSASSLQTTINSYLVLLSIVPLPLMPLISPSSVHALISRDACNSFGIWSSLGTEDTTWVSHDEFLGYGVWPNASFFNHSCSPNLHMDRIGNTLHFRSTHGERLAMGDELCICYLGVGAERMDVEERIARLFDGWDFMCMCPRCTADLRERTPVNVVP